jgi:hypothetical protein
MRSEERPQPSGVVDGTAANPPDSSVRTPDSDTLDPDNVFHLLQNQRRRYALRYLDAVESETVRMSDLAEQVAAWEHDTDPQSVSSRQRQRVYIPLYQNHLPKLARHGVIDYQQSRGIVTRLDAADQLDEHLPSASTMSTDRPHRYVLLALIVGLLAAAAWVDAVPIHVMAGVAAVGSAGARSNRT